MENFMDTEDFLHLLQIEMGAIEPGTMRAISNTIIDMDKESHFLLMHNNQLVLKAGGILIDIKYLELNNYSK